MLALLRLLGREPDALLDHASAYADLAGQELRTLGRHWTRRALWTAVAAVSALAALTLAGVGTMLWAVLPALDAGGARAWVLVLVPALPALLALLAGTLAASSRVEPPLAELKTQWREDLVLLRAAMREEPA